MKTMRLVPIALLLAAPAYAQVNYTQSPAYKECTALAASNPMQALAKADEWLKIDTGPAAQHCRAMALYGLHRYDEAATALMAVHDGLPKTDITMRSYVTQQAARAWINASRADAALTALTQQISELSQTRGDNATSAQLTAGLLLERARLNITYGKLPLAIQDLDHAVSLSPINEEVLLERAGAFEQIGDRGLARADTKVVLKINPGNKKAAEFLHALDAKVTPQLVAQPPATLQPAAPNQP